MALNIRYRFRELFLDLKMIGYNLLFPLILSYSSLAAILIGVKNNAAELKDVYVILQASFSLSASWISVYCQQNIIERNGKELMFSLPIDKVYLGPYRSLKFSFFYTILFATLSYVILARVIDTQRSLVLSGVLIFQAMFSAGFGLLSVEIVKNCYIALFMTVTYIILFLCAGEVLPETLNIFLSEKEIVGEDCALPIHPAVMAAVVWSIASYIYRHILQ